MTPEQTPTSNVDWEWYERGILEERKRQRTHMDTLTAAAGDVVFEYDQGAYGAMGLAMDRLRAILNGETPAR